MKHIYSLIIVVVLFAIACEPSFEEGDPPDVPAILSVSVGNENGTIPQTNAIYPEIYIDTVFIEDNTVNFSHMYMQASLEKGCKIEPIEGATPCGTYGDFSSPGKYRVTAPSGKTADWTVVMEYAE